ncbi:MAG: histidine phosphatase family protein [Pseudomonadota bacterium]
MKLILMRHAKSDWAFPEPDHARTLNARGRRSAKALGDWLRRANHVPDAAHVSDAVRTRETFEGLDLAETELHLHEELYHADPGVMLAVLRRADAETVLMVGHNPGIAAFAARLVAKAPEHAEFGRYPTGATTVMSFEADTWFEVGPEDGHVVDFQIPREL